MPRAIWMDKAPIGCGIMQCEPRTRGGPRCRVRTLRQQSSCRSDVIFRLSSSCCDGKLCVSNNGVGEGDADADADVGLGLLVGALRSTLPAARSTRAEESYRISKKQQAGMGS